VDAALIERREALMLKRAPVSVIVPCYRCASTIGRAVASVMGQTLAPVEIILIDDFSNDAAKTVTALEHLRQKYKNDAVGIKIVLLNQNCGPGSARNVGWEKSSQPYLAFLDADDMWHPKKLEIQYSWMAEHPNVVLTGHASIKIATSDELPKLPEKLITRYVGKYELLFTNCFVTRSVMLKRDTPHKFLPNKRYAEDYLLWLTVVLNDQKACLLNMTMAYSFKEEFGDGGLTGDLWAMQMGVIDTFQQLAKSGFISFWIFILISIFSFFKYFRRLCVVKLRFLLSSIK